MGDYRTTTGEAAPLPPSVIRRRRLRLAWAVLAVTAALAALGFFVHVPRIVSAGGYVTTEDHAEVRPGVAGIVTAILVRSGDVVQKDALLAQMDDTEQTALLEEARIQCRRAESELARREAEIAQQKRDLAERAAIAQLKQRNAETKLRRAEELRGRGLAAGSTVEDFQLQLEVASAELASLQGRDVTVFDRELDVARHDVEGQQERVARVESMVRQRQVRAPVGGQVLRYEFVVGELVQTDMVLFEIFGGERRVLRLRIDERHAMLVAPGQPYRARLVSYGGWRPQWFEGTVESLRNVIQLDGPKAYRTAYCRFEDAGTSVPPGATAEARIRTGSIPLWAYLFGVY